jgi:hypothetical protein
MKKIVIILALCLAMISLPNVSRAASSSLEVVLVDSLWGAGIGALAGTASLAFMDHPSDHYERIYQGGPWGCSSVSRSESMSCPPCSTRTRPRQERRKRCTGSP